MVDWFDKLILSLLTDQRRLRNRGGVVSSQAHEDDDVVWSYWDCSNCGTRNDDVNGTCVHCGKTKS